METEQRIQSITVTMNPSSRGCLCKPVRVRLTTDDDGCVYAEAFGTEWKTHRRFLGKAKVRRNGL